MRGGKDKRSLDLGSLALDLRAIPPEEDLVGTTRIKEPEKRADCNVTSLPDILDDL